MWMKKTIHQILVHVLAAAVIIPAFAGASQAAEEPLLMELAATTIKISTFYNGTTLEVTGSVPEDSNVVLQVSGPKHDVHLKEKGKVAGFLWMNKTDVSLENAPAVYMVYTPAGPKKDFLNPELGLGYQALVNDITIEPESEDKAFIFGEYVKLMEKSGVYAVHEAAVTYGPATEGVKGFQVTLAIPPKMNQGNYTVEAVEIKDGKAINRIQEDLTLEFSGLPATISKLAYGSPLLFGFMAVFIALGTGLIIGVIFRGGGGAH
jgi:uncharacterized protein (TIGR02186 family)